MTSKKLKVGILGIGEVGSAIAKLVKPKHNLYLKDIDKDEIQTKQLDVLHICIPYSKKFPKIITNIISKIKPKLVIIESTVPIETTHLIACKTDSLLVHSPIRGIHPNLVKCLKEFVKFIGPTSSPAAKAAKKYYASLGVKTKILQSSRETELGKLLSTTYYALCITWHQEMERFCRKYKVDFNQAITQFNQTYNQGYQQLKPDVIRPVLSPGFIGGHCLMPNINLLKQSFKSNFLEQIISSNNKKKRSA
jgi:UDP-N-acetyl-D-mannosaminuronate dehydrogenase